MKGTDSFTDEEPGRRPETGKEENEKASVAPAPTRRPNHEIPELRLAPASQEDSGPAGQGWILGVSAEKLYLQLEHRSGQSGLPPAPPPPALTTQPRSASRPAHTPSHPQETDNLDPRRQLRPPSRQLGGHSGVTGESLPCHQPLLAFCVPPRLRPRTSGPGRQVSVHSPGEVSSAQCPSAQTLGLAA